MNHGIAVRVSNRMRSVLSFNGEEEYTTGTTTIEAQSSHQGKDVELYIQNKGFGASSSKSVRTHIDNETAAKLITFLQRHLELSAKAEAMLNAVG